MPPAAPACVDLETEIAVAFNNNNNNNIIIIIMNQSGSSKSVTVRNGHQLHYQLRGNGPHAILCIPGALGTALIHFLPQLEYFGREGSGFTFVCMEPLGYGASRPPECEFVIKPDHEFFLKMDALDG